MVLPAHPEQISVEFEATAADLTRALLFAASGPRRSFAFWGPGRVVFLLVAAAFVVCGAWSLLRGGIAVWGSLLLIAVGGWLGFAATAGLRLRIAGIAKRSPGLVGKQRVVVSPDMYYRESATVTTCDRWTIFLRIEHIESDTLLFSNPSLATLIPRRAFSSDTAAREFYERIVAWREEALRKQPLGTVEEASGADVWPPTPTAVFEPLPKIEPDYAPETSVRCHSRLKPEDFAALAPATARASMIGVVVGLACVVAGEQPRDAVSIAITLSVVAAVFVGGSVSTLRRMRALLVKQGEAVRPSLLDQSFITDFETLSVRTPETATVYAVGSFYKVTTAAKHILVYISPLAALIIPNAALGGDAPARAFAARMAGAIKAAKGART